MAQTFKDYLVESEMYEHSAEHYELMKECAELALMEQYIADQEFIMENASTIYESGEYQIENGYFNEADFITESVTSFMEANAAAARAAAIGDDIKEKAGAAKDLANEKIAEGKQKAKAKIDEIKAAANTKKTSILGKITKGWKKCLDIAITLFTKIANQFSTVGQDAAAVVKALKGKTLDQESVTAIAGFITDARKKAKWQYADTDQPFAGDIAISIDSGVKFPNGISAKTFTAYLAAALTNTSVKVKPRQLKSMSNVVDAMDINELIKLADGLIKHKKKYTIDAVANQIDGAKTAASQSGIDLYANDKQLSKVVDKLKSLRDELDSENNSALTGDASVISGMNDTYSRIRNAMTATINLYNGYLVYRKTLVTQLKGYFGGATKSE